MEIVDFLKVRCRSGSHQCKRTVACIAGVTSKQDLVK